MTTRPTKAAARKRRSIIIGELTALSYRGWDKCRREDWQPLEEELKQLDEILKGDKPETGFERRSRLLAEQADILDRRRKW